MLFKLAKDYSSLEPISFYNLKRYKKLEIDLEQLLDKHLFDPLFEEAPLLPFFRERKRQPEGDIYAVNAAGDIVIFELKVAKAHSSALDQLFRYTQIAGQWKYPEMNSKYKKYSDEYDSLAEAHQAAFQLSDPLKPDDFNRNQHMHVIGSAIDKPLVDAIDYWQQKGMSIDFSPYRIYEIKGEPYFEFFAKPFDSHTNPGEKKGILFDTNLSYRPKAFKYMIEKSRISAYGGRKEAVRSISKGDLVFYSHKGYGLVAAARVVGPSIKSDNIIGEELYWDVKFLTPKPESIEDPPAMSFQEVKEVTGKNFFWAKTQKVPYLTYKEAEHLLKELQKRLGN